MKNPLGLIGAVCLLGVAVCFVFYQIQEGSNPENASGYKGVTVGPSPSPRPYPSLDQSTRTLSYCLFPKAQYGKYSSYDGGKSAMTLLQECPNETLAWMNSCEHDGAEEKKCDLMLLIAAQAAIKNFGK